MRAAEDVQFGVLIPRFMASANRVDVTMSWRPNVICVGAWILASWPSASCAMTASDSRMKASMGCLGRLRTKSLSDWT
jgi:hypothetical protein